MEEGEQEQSKSNKLETNENKEDSEQMTDVPEEPIDPKQWCATNWKNEKNMQPSVCKLRS